MPIFPFDHSYLQRTIVDTAPSMTTYNYAALEALVATKLKDRDSKVPAEFINKSIERLPREPIPRPKSKEEPWRLEPCTIYPETSVINKPKELLAKEDVAITEK